MLKKQIAFTSISQFIPSCTGFIFFIVSYAGQCLLFGHSDFPISSLQLTEAHFEFMSTTS